MSEGRTFFVPEKNYEEAKKLIRNFSSLCFDYNPIQLDGRYQISISGNPRDLEIVDKYLSLIEKPIIGKRKGLLEKLLDCHALFRLD